MPPEGPRLLLNAVQTLQKQTGLQGGEACPHRGEDQAVEGEILEGDEPSVRGISAC